MESFSVSSNLTLADWQAYQRAAVIESRNSVNARWSVAFVAVLGITWFALSELVGPLFALNFSVASCILGVVLAVLAMAAYRRVYFKASAPKDGGRFLGACSYDFGVDGIRVSRPGSDSSLSWTCAKQLTEGRDHLYLWIDSNAALVIPIRDLPSGMQREDAATRLRYWINVPNNDEAPSHPDGDEVATVVSGSLTTTLLRLLSLRSAKGAAISGSDRSILLLIVLSLGLWALVDRLRAGANAEFYPYGISSFASIAIAMMIVAWVLARRMQPAGDFRRVLVVVLGFLPFAIIVAVAIQHYLSGLPSIVAMSALGVYALLYLFRALTVLTGERQVNAAILGALVIGGFLTLGNSLYLDASLWYAPEPDEKEVPKVVRQHGESLLFDQRERIDAAIETIQPPVGAAPVFFFVGFAGVGEQKVFAEEIKLASQVVGRHYDIGNRSLLLVNDRRDFNTLPLATVSGLHYSLQRLAARMDVERDILFLALSSHGSEKPLLSVSNSGLPLKDVSGEDLASALRDSGIKWRVIVISACHAGAFIDYVRDPNTIIITAAAADKTSFGCSDDRYLTYFGEAFYRDALPQSKSLREAFDTAKAAIAAREKEENVTPSDPQAYFGNELQRKLVELNYDVAGDIR